MKHIIRAALGALLSLAVAAHAAAPATPNGSVELTLAGEMEQAYKDDKGVAHTRLVPINKIVPGDEVVYTISYRNAGAIAADKVVITDPVPEHMAYKDGSAFGAGTDIEFSVDGGKTWAKAEALKVKGADGKPRAAVGSDYTHLRWKVLAKVAPGEKGFVRFRAVLE